MKVLWLCNIMLPFIAQSLGQKMIVKEGWLSGLADRLIENEDDNEITLAICFPSSDFRSYSKDEEAVYVKGSARGVTYYIFKEDTVNPDIYHESVEENLKGILDDFKPDIVHIFGTEYPHTLAMTRAWNKPEKTLIGIQGLVSVCGEVYMAGLPTTIQNKRTFRDILKKDSLVEQQQKFNKRGEYEIEALSAVGHVTGRTDFDKEYTQKYAPKAKYHFMNETLREEFYNERWNINTIEPYSIFLSQGNYPLKGLHYMLEVLPEIVDKYDETMLYIAGDVITANDTLKDKIKISAYGKYILNMIKSKGLQKHVKFTGRLNADKMCARYLKSHVFVCPSEIENSPNSVGEAMLLGVPVIASDVGGVHNLIDDNKDGLLYKNNELSKLRDSILSVFDDDKLAMYLSSNAREHAMKTHDPKENYKRLLEIYNDINLCV